MTQRSIRRFARGFVRGGLLAGLPLLLGACAPASTTVTVTPQAAAPGPTWAVQGRVDIDVTPSPASPTAPEPLSPELLSPAVHARLDAQWNDVVQTYYTRAGQGLPHVPGSERSGVLPDGRTVTFPLTLPAGNGQDGVHVLLVCEEACVAQLGLRTVDGQAIRRTSPIRLGRGGNAWLGVTLPLTRGEARPVVAAVTLQECAGGHCAFLLRAVRD